MALTTCLLMARFHNVNVHPISTFRLYTFLGILCILITMKEE